MLDEEAKALQEVANATGKSVDLLRSLGGFLDEVLGDTLRQVGGAAADWARYFRFVNFLKVMDKARVIIHERRAAGKPLPLPSQFALPIFEGTSLETEDEVQQLWAALIANAVDRDRRLRIKKVYLEILRGLEPLDARVMEFLSDPALDKQYTVLVDATLNVDVIATSLGVDAEDVKVSLQTLARYGCVIDAWENTLKSLDTGYMGFRVDNPKSNFRLSHLGHQVVRATRSN